MDCDHPVSARTLCTLPWVQLSSNPIGKLVYCCEAREPYDEDHTASIEKFWNSPYMRSVRRALLSGDLHSYCSRCEIKERAGLNSMRRASQRLVGAGEFARILEYSRANDGATEVGPRQLDIRFSSKCNMRCRMCSADNSSELYREYAINRRRFSELEAYREWSRLDEYYAQPDSNWDIEALLGFCQGLTSIIISGGEPFLHKEFHQILDLADRRGLASQIELQITTNGTVIPHGLREKLAKFRSVTLLVSVDGEGKVYEYIRYPYKWDFISRQVLKLAGLATKNVRVLVSPTIQALNLNNLHSLIFWCVSNSVQFELFTAVADPDFLSVDVLPRPLILKAIHDLEALSIAVGALQKPQVDMLIASLKHRAEVSENEAQRLQAKFVKHMSLLDEIRGQSLSEFIPDLAHLISHP